MKCLALYLPRVLGFLETPLIFSEQGSGLQGDPSRFTGTLPNEACILLPSWPGSVAVGRTVKGKRERKEKGEGFQMPRSPGPVLVQPPTSGARSRAW